MSPLDSFSDLRERLASRDESAARDLHRLYTERLIRLASSRLAAPLRSKIDPEDVVQSVLRSFFRRNDRNEFALDGWDDLWSLLATITLRKCRFHARYFRTRKRNAALERRWESDDFTESTSLSVKCAGPTPEEVATCADLIEALCAGLSDNGRQIAELLLAGFSASEIAVRVGLTERSVFRQTRRIRRRLQELV